MTLVDTNVLLDVASSDPLWLQWSIQQVAKRAALGPVIINDVVYAEMSAQMDTEAELMQALRELHIMLQRVPTRAFSRGQDLSPLPFLRWHSHRSPSRLLHRRARAGARVPDPDPRCAAVQNVLSRRRADYAADALVGAARRQIAPRTE